MAERLSTPAWLAGRGIELRTSGLQSALYIPLGGGFQGFSFSNNVLLNSPKWFPYFPFKTVWENFSFHIGKLAVGDQFLYSHKKTTFAALILQGEDRC